MLRKWDKFRILRAGAVLSTCYETVHCTVSPKFTREFGATCLLCFAQFTPPNKRRKVPKKTRTQCPCLFSINVFLILFRQEQICDSANPFVTLWHFPCKGNLPCPTISRKKFRVWMNFFEIHNKHFISFSFSPKSLRFPGTHYEKGLGIRINLRISNP